MGRIVKEAWICHGFGYIPANFLVKVRHRSILRAARKVGSTIWKYGLGKLHCHHSTTLYYSTVLNFRIRRYRGYFGLVGTPPTVAQATKSPPIASF